MVNALRERLESVLSTLSRYQTENVYHRAAKDDAALPYIVFFSIGEVNGSDTKDQNIDYNIQFSFFDLNRNQALVSDETEQAKGLLTKSAIAGLTGYRVNWCRHVNSAEPIDGSGLYHKFLIYKISIKKE